MHIKERIDRLKTFPITHYLTLQGVQPIKAVGAELLYFSPVNTEKTPSFFVNPSKNVFNDYSGVGEKGDVIRLVQYLTKCSFMEALDQLEALDPSTLSFSFSGPTSFQKKPSKLKVIGIHPLRNPVLLAYTASRKISEPLATRYLNEVYYQVGHNVYYAVGFRNDKGGYELRNALCKNGTSPKWFTTIKGTQTNEINLFEGFFDFLSCCQLFNVNQLKKTTIVLNSLSFLKGLLPYLSTYERVNAFLDNDKAGKLALKQLADSGLSILDCSTYYPNRKDLNEHLTTLI